MALGVPLIMTHPMHVRAQRGTLLIPVILITLLLGGLSFGLLTESLAERRSVGQRRADLVALEICEMGLVKAGLEILSQQDADGDGIGTVTGTYNNGTYTVTAVQDGTLTDRWTLTAQGSYQFAVRRVEVGMRRRQDSNFVEGLFAKDTMTFNGSNTTDAYDSRLGDYLSQAVNSDAYGTYADTGGHVGSNSNIVLNGSSVAIRGNAIPGPLHETEMSGSPHVGGDTLPRRVEIDLEPASYAEFQAAMLSNDNSQLLPPGGSGGGGSGGDGGKGNPDPGGGGGSNKSSNAYNKNTMALSAKGQEIVTLKGGTYFFSDVKFTGQAELHITGPTVIYVTGEFDVSGGGFINDSGNAANLIVYAHPYALPSGHNPSSSQVKIRGGSHAAMAVYAPGAEISVAGNDDVYGALIGDTITVSGNSRFHYDKALGDIQTHSKATIERLYWRDLDEKLR